MIKYIFHKSKFQRFINQYLTIKLKKSKLLNQKLELLWMDKISFQFKIRLLIQLQSMERLIFQFNLHQIMLSSKKQFKLQRILKSIQSKLEIKHSFPLHAFQKKTELPSKTKLFQIWKHLQKLWLMLTTNNINQLLIKK